MVLLLFTGSFAKIEAFAESTYKKYLRLMQVNLLLGTEQSTAAENKKKHQM